ncbi:hypothetical protein HPB47_024712 [Ixodes persulcatus]|uniref:Uncharacterized protein n=1 Tax=Ixodes persulcatus TaxID=34615 RepID=A0AC60Q5T7_IXOPE|nr:hypothetical protein HPB47_024712 [Ixodes persulcatus]
MQALNDHYQEVNSLLRKFSRREGFESLGNLANEWQLWISLNGVHPSRMGNKVLAKFIDQQVQNTIQKMVRARIQQEYKGTTMKACSSTGWTIKTTPQPTNSCKGVIHDVASLTAPDELIANIESNVPVLTVRMMGKTETALITFESRYKGKLTECDICYQENMTSDTLHNCIPYRINCKEEHFLQGIFRQLLSQQSSDQEAKEPSKAGTGVALAFLTLCKIDQRLSDLQTDVSYFGLCLRKKFVDPSLFGYLTQRSLPWRHQKRILKASRNVTGIPQFCGVRQLELSSARKLSFLVGCQEKRGLEETRLDEEKCWSRGVAQAVWGELVGRLVLLYTRSGSWQSDVNAGSQVKTAESVTTTSHRIAMTIACG